MYTSELSTSSAIVNTVKSCRKAAASMTFLVKFCRLLYDTGFYTRQVFLYVNTKTRLVCDLMGPKLQLLFKGGFYTGLYGILIRRVSRHCP